MIDWTIQEYINWELSLEEQKVAMDFISFLKEKQLSFCKDNGAYWKDKIYYWVKSGTDCICFISVKNPDEKNNHWTVWSADMGSEWMTGAIQLIKEFAYLVGYDFLRKTN